MPGRDHGDCDGVVDDAGGDGADGVDGADDDGDGPSKSLAGRWMSTGPVMGGKPR